MSTLLLIAEIAGRRIGMTASEIHSVIDVDAVTPVPRTPDYVLGLTALRSRALTVIDCERALDLPCTGPMETAGPAIVVDRGGHLYALRVDRVEDVVPARGEPVPVPGAPGDGWSRISLGMVEVDRAAVLLVDIGQLVAGSAAVAA